MFNLGFKGKYMTANKEISREILRKYFQDRFKVFSDEINKLKGCEEKLVIQNLKTTS